MRKLLRKYGSLGSAGLTLVELIISMAILAIVGTAVGGAMYVSSRSYTRSSAEVNVQEEAQVASNLICDWLMDATSVNPDSANAGHYLTGAYDYLLITHPEGNKLVNIKVFRDGDELKYEVKDAKTNTDMGSGILCSYVKGCVFNTTFESDRNVTISIDFEVNGRTYHSVTDSSSRNHDFQSTGGGFTSGPPIIVIPDTTVVLEPGQDGDPASGGTGYVFVATLYNCDPASTVFTPAVGTPATSGDVTIAVAEGDNPGEYKIICSAPSGAATASGTFTLHAQNASGSDDEVLNVVIRRANQCVPSVGNGTLVDAPVAASTAVTFDLGLQNQSVVAGAGFDSGVYGYVDPSQVTFFYRVKNSAGVWEDALAKGYIDSHVEVTSGTPSVKVSVNSSLPDNLYVICVANHSGSVSGSYVLPGIGCTVGDLNAANKVTAISGSNYSYAGSNAFWGYFIVKKGGHSPWEFANNGFRRGTPSYEIGRLSDDYYEYLRDTLESYAVANYGKTYDDYCNDALYCKNHPGVYYYPRRGVDFAGCYTYYSSIRYRDINSTNESDWKEYVICKTTGWGDVLQHGFVQMDSNESFLFDPRITYEYELYCTVIDTHGNEVVRDCTRNTIPASVPYVYRDYTTLPGGGVEHSLFKLDSYDEDHAYQFTSSPLKDYYFFVFMNNLNVANGTQFGITIEHLNPHTHLWEEDSSLSSSIKLKQGYEDASQIPAIDGLGTAGLIDVTLPYSFPFGENPTYLIDGYHENDYPDFGVSVQSIVLSKDVSLTNDNPTGPEYRIAFHGNYYLATSYSLGSISSGTVGSVNTVSNTDMSLCDPAGDYGYIYINAN